MKSKRQAGKLIGKHHNSPKTRLNSFERANLAILTRLMWDLSWLAYLRNHPLVNLPALPTKHRSPAYYRRQIARKAIEG